MKPDNVKSDSSKKLVGETRTTSKVTASDASKPVRKGPAKIPPILLEGDAPSAPAVSGPGQRYALSPTPPASTQSAEPVELPEAYGTQRLLLTARDPHWLYAHWDLTREQLKKYNAKSVDRHLVLRVFKDVIAGQAFREIHVHPESRNWFAHVGLGATRFLAELGYYQKNGEWVTISSSAATFTPPDTLSDDLTVWLETLPADLQFDHLLKLVKRAVSENVPLIEAIQQLRASGYTGLPEPKELFSHQWTHAQERALSEVVKLDAVRRVWMGSLEITELIRRQLAHEMSSLAASQFSLAEIWSGAWSGAVSSISSPFGGAERQKGFWFNVNAELIIYGATEPSATVTIGGRTIKLRPDGTFSYRFALPDGKYDLPAVATNADKDDSRTAALQFSRRTDYQGEVGAHPQDAALKPPLAEHVS
jgi:hypothetical protein